MCDTVKERPDKLTCDLGDRLEIFSAPEMYARQTTSSLSAYLYHSSPLW